MRLIYTLLFYLSLPLIFLRLLWRARKNPHYAIRWDERLGFIPRVSQQNGIWIHAVSVGEVLAAVPLVKNLLLRHPDVPIVITTLTPTGADRVRALVSDPAIGNKVMHFYAPYDLPFAVKRFLNRIKPRLLIIIETELWPNMLHICQQRQIPVFAANARLSERSARGYGRLGSLMRGMLSAISKMAIQTQVEADRYIALGMDPTRIEVTGSIKYDLEIPADLSTRALELKKILGTDRLVWIAASTHEGEEEFVLDAFNKVREKVDNVLLMLVPRHPERFKRAAELCQQRGFNFITRSSQQSCCADTHVFIGDTMGELLLMYAAADVAYVGGSLVEKGGQNPLEPAALGLPVIMGPHLFNFAAITAQLIAANSMIKIQNANELAPYIINLLQDHLLRQQMGERGRAVVDKNRGALEKHLQMLAVLIN